MATAHPFPPAQLEAALKKVERGQPLTHDDPVLRALARAPLGEPFTPEQEAELAQDMEDIRAGRARLVPHADVPRVLEEMRRHEGR